MWKRRQDPGKVRYDDCSYLPGALVNGVHANFVAAKCYQLADREEVAMHWWLQQLSWREGGLEAFARDFLKEHDDRIARWDLDPSDFLDTPRRANIQPLVKLCGFSEDIVRRLVDPQTCGLRGELQGFEDFWGCLVGWRDREIAETWNRMVETEVSRMVFEELDFAEESRSFVLIEGREGIGKTEAARIWARRRPGRAVYIRLESGTDEASLYRAISREIGTPCRYARSLFDMRARIQDALQPAQLMLVIDEAHFL